MQSIFEHISTKLCNKTAANKLINEFEEAFARIRAFPQSCPLINNEYVKDKTIRKLIVNSYIVFYRIANLELQIIRVLYGMRNYEELL